MGCSDAPLAEVARGPGRQALGDEEAYQPEQRGRKTQSNADDTRRGEAGNNAREPEPPDVGGDFIQSLVRQ